MNITILVVDDHKPVVDTLRAILEMRGYVTDGAYSGREAIAKAATSRPKLLLCEVVLPDLNGFEVAVQIKQLCPDCRIIFISGHQEAFAIVRRYAGVFNTLRYRFELLPKPSHPSLLLQKIEEALPSGAGLVI